MEKSTKAKGIKLKVKQATNNSKKASAGNSVLSPEGEGIVGNGVFTSINQVIKRSSELDAKVALIEQQLLTEDIVRSLFEQLQVSESLSSSRISTQTKSRLQFTHNISVFLQSKNAKI